MGVKKIYATRRSALALAQSRAFVGTLRLARPDLELVEKQVITTGDKIQDKPLADIGGKGLFVKEIEEALLASEADFAVHSIKDVPATLAPGLSLACVPKREDPRDVIVSPKYKTLAALPEHAKVGTSSMRRAIALKTVRPDLVIVPMRGNVDTRLRKVEAGECDAIVLARAGLVRLNLEARATEVLDPRVSLPAIGQGALGIETREGDDGMRTILTLVDDEETAVAVWAERGVLEALGGDCKTPIAAHAQRVGHRIHLEAFIAEMDGSNLRRNQCDAPWPVRREDARTVGLELGRRLAT
jgi:hydroxymethylbilane synthase